MKTDTKILFISRAYPPVVGGIENQNFELSQWLPKYADVTTIANTKGKKALPFFLPWMLLKLTFTSRQYDVILLGDGVLGILGWWVKCTNKKTKVVCIAHGLDLTFKSNFYQKWWVGKFIPASDKIIAVGNQTIKEGIVRGITKDLFTFIPNGIDPEKFIHFNGSKESLYQIIGQEHKDKKVILTSGRLAKRKGVAWFIRSVLSELPEDIIYVVAGDGPDKENIVEAVRSRGLQNRVILLGYVSDTDRNTLFHTCDIFVQPNITVAGDMEGFGISVIEAAASSIPVLASYLEGLKDAIIDGQNGFSVESGNPKIWQNNVLKILADDFDRETFSKSAAAHVTQHNSWEKISQDYISNITSL